MRKIPLLALMVAGTLTLFVCSQPPTQKASGPGKPLTPAEAVKHFKIAAGLRIELAAAEPLVQSPVHIAFGADGRLWVVEMPDYPNGPPPGKPPEGRIRVLEDKDADGVYDHATTFAEGLLFANGLIPWKDGVIVTAAPHIVWLRDPKRTGKATEKEILFEGFAALNPQLRVSHPILGLDGWIYVANGLRGGKVVKAGVKDAEPVNLSGLDFRFDMISGKYEAISGPGQFGNTFDDWGNRFVCDNRHHLRHVVLENRYVRRNPYLAPPALVEDISELDDGPLSSGGKIYPLSKNWTTSSLHEGRFTAACGVHVYRGNLLPKEFQGAAFTCDPTGNLVHGEVLTPHGATFKARPLQKGVEFLASPDDWFRPVSLASGPDGALYVVDMYRAVIEHPEFMPPELKNRPDLLLGKDKGRIWRIVPEKHQTKTVPPKLDKASIPDLIAALENPDGWWRTTAARLLFEKDDPNKIALLQDGIGKAKDPRARIQLAYLVNTKLVNAKERGILEHLPGLLKDPYPRVREHAIILAATSPPYLDRKRIVELSQDPDARVRYQVALVLGDFEDAKVASPLAKITLGAADDKWTRLAAASSTGDFAGLYFQHLIGFKKELDAIPLAQRSLVLQEAAGLVGGRKDRKEMELALQSLGEIGGPDAFQVWLPAMTGLAEGAARRGTRLEDVVKEIASDADPAARKWLRQFERQTQDLAGDAKGDSLLRLQAVRYLAHLPLTSVQDSLVRLLQDDPSQEVRIAAVRSLAAHPERQVAVLLLKPWRGYTPAVRREVLEAMFRNPLRINTVLDEIEAKRLKPGDLDPLRMRQLLAHKNPTIRERADSLLKSSLPAARKGVLEQYQMALVIEGDAKRGQEVFKKNCATCHKVAGIGLDVGPDIADTRTKTESALLVDILSPNQAIDNNYINYVVTTKSGRTLTGLLAAETASSITLKRAEGQGDVVLRQDIDQIESTGISLMPEGLEKTIPVQDMADLLRFLKNWRYLDGTVPLRK